MSDSFSLFQRLKSPWQLLRSNSLGLKIHYQPAFWLIFSVFSINILCFAVGIFRFFQVGISISNLTYWIFALLSGVLVIIYTFRQVYQYLIVELLKAVYTSITQLIQEVSANLVLRAEQLFLQRTNLSAEQLEKSLQLPQLLQTQYSQLPAFLQNIIVFLLSNLPFVGLLLDLKEQIITDKAAATLQFQSKINQLSARFLVRSNALLSIYYALIVLFLIDALVLFVLMN